MKILLLTPGGTGGVNTQVRLLRNSLIKTGHDSRLFLTTRPSGASILFSLVNIPFFIVQTLKFKPDICYIPLASNGSFYRKTTFAAILRISKIPYAIHIHGGGFKEFYEGLGKVRKRLAKWLFRSADHIFLLHSGQRNLCDRILENSKEPEISILPNGIEIQEPTSTYKAPKASCVFEFIFIGDVTARKGVDSLIQLNEFLRVNNIRIKFVGKIHEDIEVKRSAFSSQNLTQFDFLGALPHSAAMKLLAHSHLLILPSRVENFPNVILEAFSLGVPVLASRVGAIPEIISSGVNGWLLPFGEVDESSVRVGIELVIAEKSQLSEISKRAKSEVSSKFDVLNVAGELTRALADALDE